MVYKKGKKWTSKLFLVSRENRPCLVYGFSLVTLVAVGIMINPHKVLGSQKAC